MKHAKPTKWGTSLTDFFFDGKPAETDYEKLLEKTMKEWFKEKHRINTDFECSLINSLPVAACPYCAGTDFKRNGISKYGIRRFRCNSCGHSFNPLSGTLFDQHRIPISEWFEFVMHLLRFDSVQDAAFSNRNAHTTGSYWLLKTFVALKDEQSDVVLEGRIVLDEKYIPMPSNRLVTRKDGKKLRGLSRNKICVATAVDGRHNMLFVASGNGKPSEERLLKAFENHIKEGSTIVHDGEKSHGALIEKYSLQSVAYNAKDASKMKNNPLQPINEIHSYMRMFFDEHSRFDRRDIQHWLNLFHFIMAYPLDGYRKIAKLLEKMTKTQQIVRFRDALDKDEKKKILKNL